MLCEEVVLTSRRRSKLRVAGRLALLRSLPRVGEPNAQHVGVSQGRHGVLTHKPAPDHRMT
jgi:hypothetical protein